MQKVAVFRLLRARVTEAGGLILKNFALNSAVGWLKAWVRFSKFRNPNCLESDDDWAAIVLYLQNASVE